MPLKKQIQKLDKKQQNKVISNMGLVRMIAGKIKHNFYTYEDIVQIGTIGLIQAVNNFDASRTCGDSGFGHYAYYKIKAQIQDAIKSKKPILVVFDPKEFKTDKCIKFEDISNDASEKFVDLINEVMPYLSDIQQKIIKMKFGFNGQRELTGQEIGNKLGISKQRVHQIMTDAYKILKIRIKYAINN